MEIGKSLTENLKKLCVVLDTNGVQFCLIGGLAVSIISQPRATEDIDLLVLFDDENKDDIEDLMRNNFDIFQVHPLIDFGEVNIWRFVIKDTFTKDPQMILIDFIQANHERHYHALKNRTFIEVDKIKIPVAAIDDLINMKSASDRLKDKLDVEVMQQKKRDYQKE